MRTKRLPTNPIHFAGDFALHKQVSPYLRRHLWSDFLTPFGWAAALATIGVLMFGAALGFVN